MAAPPSALQTRDGTTPALHYFIIRQPSGALVPLIPADELPYSVRLTSVPRVLSPDQITGLQCVGPAPFSGAFFKLDPGSALHSRNSSGTDTIHYHSSQHSANTYQPNNFQKPPSRPGSAPLHEVTTNWRQAAPTSEPQSVIDAILNTPDGAGLAARTGYQPKSTILPPSGKLPNPAKKEYCTHWIIHNECAYLQQGCAYKHEMPSLDVLTKVVGLRDYPKWWKERNRQLKLGGSGDVAPIRAIGPVKSVKELLNERRGQVVEADDDGSSSDEEVVDESDGSGRVLVSKAPTSILKRPTMPVNNSDAAAPKATEVTGTPTGDRKASLDLIDFGDHNRSSASTSSDASPKTESSITPPTSPEIGNSPPGSPKAPTSHHKGRRFVPKPSPHSATVAQQSVKRAINATLVQAAPLQKQIQDLQKGKQSTVGLAASKHAPAAPNGVAIGCAPSLIAKSDGAGAAAGQTAGHAVDAPTVGFANEITVVHPRVTKAESARPQLGRKRVPKPLPKTAGKTAGKTVKK